MNEDFIKKILELAKRDKGVHRSQIFDRAFHHNVKHKDVGKHIKECRNRGMYSVPDCAWMGDTYYQYDGE